MTPYFEIYRRPKFLFMPAFVGPLLLPFPVIRSMTYLYIVLGIGLAFTILEKMGYPPEMLFRRVRSHFAGTEREIR